MEAFASNELKDVYIWGIELIYGLKNYSIQRLKISEEVSYYQRKAFSTFAEELYKRATNSNEKCQSDIIDMILDNFTLKFNQRVFNKQEIVHVNDLKLLIDKNSNAI